MAGREELLAVSSSHSPVDGLVDQGGFGPIQGFLFCSIVGYVVEEEARNIRSFITTTILVKGRFVAESSDPCHYLLQLENRPMRPNRHRLVEDNPLDPIIDNE